jgi:hypothetical protein
MKKMARINSAMVKIMGIANRRVKDCQLKVLRVVGIGWDMCMGSVCFSR